MLRSNATLSRAVVRTLRPTLVAAALGATLSAFGCSSDVPDHPPVYTVEGRATYQGRPMAGASVTFHPRAATDRRAVFPMGVVGPDGRYRLTSYITGDGAPAGDYVVTIVWPAEHAAPSAERETAADLDYVAPDRLKRAYADAAKSKLRATVEPRANTLDWKLP